MRPVGLRLIWERIRGRAPWSAAGIPSNPPTEVQSSGISPACLRMSGVVSGAKLSPVVVPRAVVPARGRVMSSNPPQWGRTSFGAAPPVGHPPSPPPWPRPPWWTSPWPAQPPNPPWAAPPWVSGFSRCGPSDWRTTEEAWWWWGLPSQWWRFRRNPWEWCGAGLKPGVPDPWLGRVSMGAVQCQAGCPAGAIPGVWGWKGNCRLPGCPLVCRGCQAGWAYDANLRHIGPIPLPAANRFDCNRVKWLGQAAVPAQSAGAVGGASLA